MKYLMLDEIKRHLTVDHDMDDALLTTMGDAAENATEKHIGQPIYDTFVDGQIPSALKQAMLMFVGSLYNNRESESAASLKTNASYEALLGPFRKY